MTASGMERRCSQQYPASSGVPRSKGARHASQVQRSAVLGIDIGKNVFHLIGLDNKGAIVLRPKAVARAARSTACQHATLAIHAAAGNPTSSTKPTNGPTRFRAASWKSKPDRRKRDLDNIAGKAVLDVLVAHHVIADNSMVVAMSSSWDTNVTPSTIRVTVAPALVMACAKS